MKILKYFLSLCLVLGLLVNLTGCPQTAQEGDNKKAKGMVYYSFFDTVSYVYSYSGDTQGDFEANCNEVSEILDKYHKLFNIYYDFAGVTNLKTINDNAGGEPFKVDSELIDFLLYAKELYTLTNGEMNIMMGAVLRPWHDARTNKSFEGLYCEYCGRFSAAEDCVDGKCPQSDPDHPGDEAKKCQRPIVTFEYAIEKGSKHISFESLEIDPVNNTVRITDPEASIDVGALGKGYATEMAAQHLKNKNVNGYVLNIGGNIRIVGTKTDGTGWLTGIKDPKAPNEKYASYITIANTSCVTSGDYERFFSVGGKQYHHIIDKDTGLPAEYFSSVTIITENSGLADCLSTALFCMSYEDGLELVSSLKNVDVLWIFPNGEMKMTDGYKSLVTERN